MANSPGTTVTITAVDQVTKTIDSITKRMKAFSAPYEKMQNSFGQLADVTGLNRIGRAFGDMGRSARDAATGVGRVAEQLGFITGAASIAGVIKMTTAWADWGSTLQFNARRVGMASNSLYQLQNAGRLAGLSAQQVTAGITHLKDAMTDTLGGRGDAGTLRGYFNLLHISMKQLHGDAASLLPQISDGLAKLMKKDPSLAARVNGALLGDDNFLRLLGGGDKNFEAYLTQAKSLGFITEDQAKKADQLRQSQVALTEATESFGILLSATLEPVLRPVIDYMTGWVIANKDLVASDITNYVKEFVQWLGSPDFQNLKRDFRDAYAEIKHVVHELGGVEAAIKDVLALLTLGFALKIAAPFLEMAGAIDAAILKTGKLAVVLREMKALKAVAATAEAEALAGGATAEAAKAAGVAAKTEPAAIAAARVAALTVVGGAAGWAALLAAFAYLAPHAMSYLFGHGWSGTDDSEHGNPMAGRGHAAGSGPNAKMRFNAARAQDDVADFMRMGWTRPQANIIEGNLQQESGLNEGIRNKTSGAYGLAQWLGPRAADFQRVEGVPLVNSTRAQQRAFINWELHNTEAKSGALLHTLNNESQAAQFGRSYERYGAGEEGSRVSYAQQLAAPMRIATAAPGAVGGGDAKMHIVVEAANGAKATVKTASNNVVTRMAPGVAQTDMGWAGAF